MELTSWPWKPRPDYGRLLRAVEGTGDPAHVPFLELFADSEVIAAALGEHAIPRDVSARPELTARLDQMIRFWSRLGYDAVWQGAILDFPEHCRLEADDTAPIHRRKRRWVDESKGVITDWDGFEQYPWPRVEDTDYFPLEYLAKHLPDGMAIIASMRGILEPVMWLMGYETFALAIHDEPDLVKAMFDRVAGVLIPHARALAEMDRVVALWMGDDMGFKTGTMIAPEHMRRYVFPIQKQISDIAHQHGMPFLLHSCGNLEGVMEDLISYVRIDARHSFEDVIEPVESFCARYAGRIAVIGGVDVDLLARGTEEQVRARTREVLQACAPSRRYVLGSGNSIANYIPLRNFLAMVDEGWRYNTQIL